MRSDPRLNRNQRRLRFGWAAIAGSDCILALKAIGVRRLGTRINEFNQFFKIGLLLLPLLPLPQHW